MVCLNSCVWIPKRLFYRHTKTSSNFLYQLKYYSFMKCPCTGKNFKMWYFSKSKRVQQRRIDDVLIAIPNNVICLPRKTVDWKIISAFSLTTKLTCIIKIRLKIKFKMKTWKYCNNPNSFFSPALVYKFRAMWDTTSEHL